MDQCLLSSNRKWLLHHNTNAYHFKLSPCLVCHMMCARELNTCVHTCVSYMCVCVVCVCVWCACVCVCCVWCACVCVCCACVCACAWMCVCVCVCACLPSNYNSVALTVFSRCSDEPVTLPVVAQGLRGGWLTEYITRTICPKHPPVPEEETETCSK